jgi:Flp pilus assembly protein TadG
MIRSLVRKRLRLMREDERGVTLVFVAVSMTFMLGFAAIVIDVGAWYAVHRHAQAAADAAALAGAQDLPASQSTATTDAQAYVTKNFNGATPTVTFPSSSQIKVVVSTTGPIWFGKIFGASAPTITASATASSSATAVAGPIYANSTSCSAISFTGLNGGVQMGGLVTNGGISFGGSNSATVSSISYNSTCGAPAHNAGVTITSSSTNAGGNTFPLDYRNQLASINCNGNGGTVSESSGVYTYSQSSITLTNNQVLSGVYCAQTINLSNSLNLSGTATFIADNFGGGAVSDTGTLTPSYGSLLLWQTGATQLQINSTTFTNGSVIFAPTAQIYLNSNALTGGAQTALLEGDTVLITSMNGGGLGVPSGLSTASSRTSLTQ